MRKILLLLLLTCCANLSTHAQTPQFPEPEFVGHVLAILPGDTTKPLAQESMSPRHRNSVSAELFGIGRTHINEMMVKGSKAIRRFKQGDGIALIVRVVDNQIDPMSEINVFRFKTTKKLRLAEYSSEGTLGDKQTNTLEHQPFTARRFGESSYLIVLQDPQPGEYGITVNALGNLNVSTFGIDK